MMKTFTRLALLLAMLSWSLAYSQTAPTLMNYQGELTDEFGHALGDGDYELRFTLYDQPVGGEKIWTEEKLVTFLQGRFNLVLGNDTDLGDAFAGPDRYLEITVVRIPDGTTIERSILPRQKLLSAPYAMRANVAADLIKELADALCPPGSIMPFAGMQIPEGWLLCDGTVLGRRDYSRLFGAIGTAWGTTTENNFRVPDLRGYFLRGHDGTAGRDPDRDSRIQIRPGGNLGNTVGSAQVDELRSHSHTYHRDWTGGNPSPSNPGVIQGGGTYPRNFLTPTTTTSGGSETRPRNAYVNFIIKY